MPDDLKQTWDDIAHRWADWGPPLRPCAEDLRITRRMLSQWHAKNPVAKANVFLCGVTPEIVTMDWPFPIELVGMDQAESMVQIVWPGDVPGVRQARVGNWSNSGLPEHSQDVIIGDGGFGFFSYPDGQRTLIRSMAKLLRPKGLFLYRHYASPEQRETLHDVRAALQAARIGNFHVLKWRVAMAIEHDTSKGVKQHDVWQAFQDLRLDPAKLPQPGFSERAIGTMEFYRGKEARLYFPTLNEFRGLLSEFFEGIEVVHPGYELGERCPILTARAKTD